MKKFDGYDAGTKIIGGLIVIVIVVAAIGLGLTVIGLIWRAAAWVWEEGG